MKSYLVRWEVDIFADTAREAAEKALALLGSNNPKHKIFKVIVSGGHGVTINLAKSGDSS